MRIQHAKCSPSVAVRVSKTHVLKLLIESNESMIQADWSAVFHYIVRVIPSISLICNPRIKTLASIQQFASINHVFLIMVLQKCQFSKIMQPLCRLFFQHGCILFFKFASFFINHPFALFFPSGMANQPCIQVFCTCRFLKFFSHMSSPHVEILL